MISYALTVGGILLATLIPAYLALYIVSNLKHIQTKYIAAAGVGLTFWFFFDTMGDAAQLDVNSSFGGGFVHFGVLVAFIGGIATLAIFDHFAVPSDKSSSATTPKAFFLIPVAVAAVMGIHGLGEGWDFASAASQTSTQNLIDAFGGWGAVISYPLHKFFEASIIASVYACYVARNNPPVKAKWQIPVLGLLFGLTSVIGSSLGYYISLNTTYFYAFGVTAAFYAVIRLVEAMNSGFRIGENAPAYLGGKVFLAMTIGFFLLYTAALFH